VGGGVARGGRAISGGISGGRRRRHDLGTRAGVGGRGSPAAGGAEALRAPKPGGDCGGVEAHQAVTAAVGMRAGRSIGSVKKTALTGGIITIAVVFFGSTLVGQSSGPSTWAIRRGFMRDLGGSILVQNILESFILYYSIDTISLAVPCLPCFFKYTSKYIGELPRLKISNISSFNFLEMFLDTYFVMFSPSYFIRICLYYNIVLFHSFYIRFESHHW